MAKKTAKKTDKKAKSAKPAPKAAKAAKPAKKVAAKPAKKAAAKPVAKKVAAKPAKAAKVAPQKVAKVEAKKGADKKGDKKLAVAPVAKKGAAAKEAGGKDSAAPKDKKLKAPVAAPEVVEAKGKKGKKAKVEDVEEVAVVEPPVPVKDVVMTDAEGREICRAKDCDQPWVVEAYCRYHYLLFWKKIQNRKKILSEGKLEQYIEELTSRYPLKFLELIRKDLSSEPDFHGAIQELDIDENNNIDEFEDENFMEEVRGIGSTETERVDDEY